MMGAFLLFYAECKRDETAWSERQLTGSSSPAQRRLLFAQVIKSADLEGANEDNLIIQSWECNKPKRDIKNNKKESSFSSNNIAGFTLEGILVAKQKREEKREGWIVKNAEIRECCRRVSSYTGVEVT